MLLSGPNIRFEIMQNSNYACLIKFCFDKTIPSCISSGLQKDLCSSMGIHLDTSSAGAFQVGTRRNWCVGMRQVPLIPIHRENYCDQYLCVLQWHELSMDLQHLNVKHQMWPIKTEMIFGGPNYKNFFKWFWMDALESHLAWKIYRKGLYKWPLPRGHKSIMHIHVRVTRNSWYIFYLLCTMVHNARQKSVRSTLNITFFTQIDSMYVFIYVYSKLH